jgi:nucleoside-diphosphate-sugar epimerase
MSQSILITGHTGTLGREVLSTLSARSGVQVHGVSRRAGLDLEAADAADKMDRDLPKISTIVHLAGLKGVARSWKDPQSYFRSNYLMTLSVLELARRRQARVVLMSSYLYGTPKYLPVDERHALSAPNPYAASKLVSERLAESYCQAFSIDVTALRLFNVYGFVDEGPEDTRDVISEIFVQLRRSPSVRLRTLSPRRDYLHVSDVSDAVAAAALSPAPKPGFSAYNLGSGKSHSVGEVVDCLKQLWPSPIEISQTGDSRTNEIDDCFCDPAKFRGDFQWSPRVDLREGLRRLTQNEIPKEVTA